METESGPVGAESGPVWPHGGGGAAPPEPPALMGSFPTPKGGLSGCHGDLWMLAGRFPGSTLEGRVLGAKGSPGWGAWTGKQGAPHLVAQHEPVAVGLGDLAPAHQHAAGGGGQRRHVGGAGGRHWGGGRGKEALRTQRGPRSGGWRGSGEGPGARSPNSKLSRDRDCDALGSGASHVLLLARGEPPMTPAQTQDRKSLHFLRVPPRACGRGEPGGKGAII